MTTLQKHVRIMFTTAAIVNSHQQSNAEMNSSLQGALNNVNSPDIHSITAKAH